MFREHYARLHHVQVVDFMNINSRKTFGQEICLLLIIPFETDSIARSDDGLKQRNDVARFHYLMCREDPPGGDSHVARTTSFLPSSHVAFLALGDAFKARTARSRPSPRPQRPSPILAMEGLGS